MTKQIKGTALLLLAALIWGSTFVAQSVGMDLVGPFTFQATRQILGFIVLLPVIFLRRKANIDPANKDKTKKDFKKLLGYGALCGAILFCACNLQQFGLTMGTTAGKSGFITALYIILVPIAGIFFKKKTGVKVWIAVVLAVVGLYFLCIKENSFTIGKGELLTLACSICFTCHILVIDHVSPKVDGVQLSALQFLFSGLISFVCMLFTETVVMKDVLACWLPICYAGILSCGVAYTLQILAQREIYFRVIKDAVHTACAEATNLREARIGVGKGICNINENRDIETPNGWWIGRHGKGYSNKKMTVIQLIDNAGKKIACGVIRKGRK